MTGTSLPTFVYFDLSNTLIFGRSNNRQPFADAADTLQPPYELDYRRGLLSNQALGTTADDVNAHVRSTLV